MLKVLCSYHSDREKEYDERRSDNAIRRSYNKERFFQPVHISPGLHIPTYQREPRVSSEEIRT